MLCRAFFHSLRPEARRRFLGIFSVVREADACNFGTLRADLFAAVAVTLVSIPQVLGFALVLELPPVMVLTCAVVGAFAAASFFSSRLLIFGATNSITLLVASAIHQVGSSKLSLVELAVILAVLIGAIQIAAGLFRIGAVTQFISRSVIIGYSAATGGLLALTQLHNIFGLARDRSAPIWTQLQDYMRQTGRHLIVSGVHGEVLRVLKRSGLLKRIGLDNVFPAEENATLATRRALVRASRLLKNEKTAVRIYYDHDQATRSASAVRA